MAFFNRNKNIKSADNLSENVEKVNVEIEKPSNVPDPNGDFAQTGRESGKRFSILDTLRLIYCMMAADGFVNPEEEEKLIEIGNDLDADLEELEKELQNEKALVLKAWSMNEEDYYDFIHAQVAGIIYEAEDTAGGISARTLLWNLLVMAFSEGNYTDNEKRLIRFITRTLKVDPAIPLEMEQALRTVAALDKEEEWLKTANRSFSAVESQITQVRERREMVIKGVHALIAD